MLPSGCTLLLLLDRNRWWDGKHSFPPITGCSRPWWCRTCHTGILHPNLRALENRGRRFNFFVTYLGCLTVKTKATQFDCDRTQVTSSVPCFHAGQQRKRCNLEQPSRAKDTVVDCPVVSVLTRKVANHLLRQSSLTPSLACYPFSQCVTICCPCVEWDHDSSWTHKNSNKGGLFQLDYMLVSEQLQGEASVVRGGYHLNSDHWPIDVFLRLERKELWGTVNQDEFSQRGWAPKKR